MSEPVTFESLNLSPAILKAVEELGYKTPSEIQAQCIPLLLERKDVLGLAQTGTGKTAAFALPLLNNIDPSVNSHRSLYSHQHVSLRSKLLRHLNNMQKVLVVLKY